MQRNRSQRLVVLGMLIKSEKPWKYIRHDKRSTNVNGRNMNPLQYWIETQETTENEIVTIQFITRLQEKPADQFRYKSIPGDPEKQAAHQLWCSAGRTAIQAFSMKSYKPSEQGQTDLVFGLWSEFIIRSVHVGLQVSMPPWLTHRHTDRQLLSSYTISSASQA